jgi:serine/threonine protein kinase
MTAPLKPLLIQHPDPLMMTASLKRNRHVGQINNELPATPLKGNQNAGKRRRPFTLLYNEMGSPFLPTPDGSPQTHDRFCYTPSSPFKTDFFSKITDLRSGGSSEVKLAWPKEANFANGNDPVVLKMLSTSCNNASTERELWCLQNLEHPFLCHSSNSLGCPSIMEDDLGVTLVCEFANCGDCLELIEDRKVLGKDIARDLFGQLLKAVAFLHQNGVAHCDIKLENIMLHKVGDNNLCIKLGDFGLSRVGALGDDIENITQQSGSSMWMAPEQHDNRSFNGKSADMWSCGIALFIMLTGRPPFFKATPSDPYYQQIDKKSFFDSVDCVTPDAKDLISRLLSPRPKDRPTADEALRHSYFLDHKSHQTTS